ncbi:DUF3630 family protein [Vibrio sp. JC009]|uniref:DUF3630 family protein n=1 Tax=Vibrio sp. JC009 TaxID=2912314 RepID=UPI0023AEC41F|nr:DUF3630 family protein [Vibrio sp. JC009]WED21791.1 DUF3630 family protein [Vibrio sp. JC009]
MADFGLAEYSQNAGKLILITPDFDFDSFPVIGERLVSQLSAKIIEKQTDADIHSWLIDFEGCQFMLKAEHYSESVWLEAMDVKTSREEVEYLSRLFQAGI